MHRIIWSLAIAQTIFWASTFYLIPALLPILEASTDWTKSQISLAMTGSLLASALLSPLVGRFIDLGHGRLIMSGGGIFIAVLLVIFSQSSSIWALYACWLGIGICLAGTLYEPCFAIITRHMRHESKPLITRVTLVAGFAGTASFPACNIIASYSSWRVAVLVFATLTVCVAVPLAAYGIRQLETLRPFSQAELTNNNRPALGNRITFWLLAVSFALGGIAHGMVVTHILPLLAERGITASVAVSIAMIIGPMQVVGRLITMATEKHVSTVGAAFGCFVGTLLACGLLYVADASLPAIIGFATFQGASWGVVSIVRPSLARDYLGQDGFGLTSGRLAAIFTLGFAIAPFAGASLWATGGYDLMLMICMALSIIGGLLLWQAHQRHVRKTRKI